MQELRTHILLRQIVEDIFAAYPLGSKPSWNEDIIYEFVAKRYPKADRRHKELAEQANNLLAMFSYTDDGFYSRYPDSYNSSCVDCGRFWDSPWEEDEIERHHPDCPFRKLVEECSQ